MSKLKGRRYTALLAAVMMVLVVLSSCNHKKADPESSTEGSIATAVSTAAESASETTVKSNDATTENDYSRPIASNAGTTLNPNDKVDPTEEQIISIKALTDPVITENVSDLNGAHIKVGSYVQFTEAYSDWFGGREAYLAAQVKQVEKDYNCVIDWIPLDINNYANTIITAKAAGIVPVDIFFGWYPDLINAGILADLRTVSAVNLGENEWNAAAVLGSTFNSKVYGVRAGDPIGEMIWFNKTLAEQYDLGNFYDMVINKEWTFNKFVSICQEIYNKSNQEIYGAAMYYRSDINYFVLANGADPVIIQNGKAVYNGTDPNVLEALNLATLQGVFNPQQDYTTGWRGRSLLIDGKVLFSIDHQGASSVLNNHMTDEYGCLPFPMGPNSNGYTHVIYGTPGQIWSLYDEDPDIEMHGQVMTALANRCHSTVEMYDEFQISVLRDEDSLKMLHYVLGDQIPLKRSALVPSFSTAFSKIVTGEQTPAQAMQAIQNQAGVELDEYYNQGGGKAFFEPD